MHQAVAARVASELQGFSRTLLREYERAVDLVGPRLSENGFASWSDEAVHIARSSFRSWETASELLKASPDMISRLDEAAFLAWARVGRDLTSSSSAVASAYFQSSPMTLRTLLPGQFAVWAALGRSLHGESWKSISLATRFFEQSPLLLREIGLSTVATFVHFLATLSIRSYEAAADCLEHGQRIINTVPEGDREQFLALADRLAPASWKAGQTFFKEGPAVLRGIEPGLRTILLNLAGRLAGERTDEAFQFLRESAAALSHIPAEERSWLVGMGSDVFDLSWKSMVEFLKMAPSVEKRAGRSGLAAWFDYGRRLLANSEEAGTAYFRMQSSRARSILDYVSPGVELSQVRELLRVYCKAIAGKSARVSSTEELSERGIGWTKMERPATDGAAIHLPPYLESYGSKAENFAAYKVLATHQAGHLEFGTFEFDFALPAAVHDDNLRQSSSDRTTSDVAIAEPLRSSATTSRGFPGAPSSSDPESSLHGPESFELFFDLFSERKLAKDLFTVAEDFRIDRRIIREYPGIRRAFAVVQTRALNERPAGRRPLREEMVETLVRLSLAVESDAAGLAARPLARLLAPLADPRSRVEDSAEATIRLYRFITELPNIPLSALRPEEVSAIDGDLDVGGYESAEQPTGAGEPYHGMEPVQYRDDLKPELVEALARAKSDDSETGQSSGAMSPEELKRLLEKSGELDLAGLSEGQVNQSLGMFVTNLLREGSQKQASSQDTSQVRQTIDGQRTGSAERHGLSATEPRCFLYDEWDFRANDYRPGWCRLKEQVLKEGSTEFYEKTLETHSALVKDIRKQFERLRPEAFKRIKKLQDGEEYDLDAVIEHFVERRAQTTPSEKIYWRKNKIERDVAVAFLLDMSASTDEEIEDRPRPAYYPDTLTTFRWDRNAQWHWNWDEPIEEPRKRIIDVEKESLVLLIRALETIGDTYGIYGFSGYGRDNVEFFVIKDLKEGMTDRVKARVEKVAPVQGTRMGPALRHCITKLSEVDAKLKLLVLISDGRPQDHDYGKDRTEKEYAIHDTRMALLEAKRRQIVPFCLTVDRFGHDYLKAMCGDIGYEVVSNIEALPKRLPALYRRLTT